MEPSLHDIVQCLTMAKGYAELMAEQVQQTEPEKARALMSFSQELGNVWGKYQPILLPHAAKP